MKRIITGMIVVLASMLWSLPSPVAAQQQYVVKPVAQKKIKQLPTGPLYWRVENFPTLADAKAAVGPDGWNPASVRYVCRGRPHDEWTSGRHADASLQRRHDRSDRPDHVRGGCEQAVLGADQVEMR